MTGIRVNLSHGTLENQQEHLALIREAGILKILIDLQGPELRIGDLTEPLELPEGAETEDLSLDNLGYAVASCLYGPTSPTAAP